MVCNSKGKCHSPIFSSFVVCLCAKYRTMTFSLTITDPSFFTLPLPSNPISHQLSHREGFLISCPK